MKVPIVIPARLTSSRIDRKPLVEFGGMTLVERVVDHAMASKKASQVIVATDSQEVYNLLYGRMIENDSRLMLAENTRQTFRNGTERVAAVLKGHKIDFQYAINLQCDEPEITGADLDRMIDHLEQANPSDRPAMLTYGFHRPNEARTANVVKVAVDLSGRAMHFSRAPMAGSMTHVGVYALGIGTLCQYVSWDPTPLEKAERLEQLRILEHGLPCEVLDLGRQVQAINTPADLYDFKRKYRRQEADARMPASR